MLLFDRTILKRPFILACGLLTALTAPAQTLFHYAFGYESNIGNLEPVTGPSGYLICSTVRFGLGNIDGFQFTRFDSTGHVVHTAAFSTGPLTNVMQDGALSRCRSNGTYAFLFGTWTNGVGTPKSSLRVFNTTPAGLMNWNRRIEYAAPNYSIRYLGAMEQAFEETPDGGYLISGLRSAPAPGPSDTLAPMVVKLDSMGNVLWNKTYSLDLAHAWHIVSDVDSSGATLLGFHADSLLAINSDNCFLTRIDPAGNTLWSKLIDGLHGRLTSCVGVHSHYAISAEDSTSTYLMELDTAGVPIWGKRYVFASPLDTWGAGIVPTHDHGFVLQKEVPDSVGGIDVFLFKVDSVGAVQWERRFGNLNYEWPIDLVENADSTFTLLAGTQLFAIWSGFYFSELDAIGMNDCITPADGTVTESTIPFALVDVALNEFEPPMTSQPLYFGDTLGWDPVMVDTCLYPFTLDVHEQIPTQGPTIYPDPCHDLAILHLDPIADHPVFQLLDVLGRPVKRLRIASNDTPVDVSDLPGGIYLYRITTDRGQRWSGRLLKE